MLSRSTSALDFFRASTGKVHPYLSRWFLLVLIFIYLHGKHEPSMIVSLRQARAKHDSYLSRWFLLVFWSSLVHVSFLRFSGRDIRLMHICIFHISLLNLATGRVILPYSLDHSFSWFQMLVSPSLYLVSYRNFIASVAILLIHSGKSSAFYWVSLG